jgi:competence protein ComEC
MRKAIHPKLIATMSGAFSTAFVLTMAGGALPASMRLCGALGALLWAFPMRRHRVVCTALAAGGICAAILGAYPLQLILPLPSELMFLNALRASVIGLIGRLYTEPHAAFLTGLLTGDRAGMPYDVTLAFRRTGLSHILAISGSNITLVVTLLTSMLFFLPIRWRLPPVLVGIVLFVLFVGPGASVVRAAIMGVIGLIAMTGGRKRHARLSILWAAVVMLAWNPSLIRDDAGFQLSFLSVIGLTELSRELKTLLRRLPEAMGLQEALVATLAAQATAVPWAVLIFGDLPLLSPVANLLAAPLIAPSTLLGGVSVFAGAVYEPLGRLLAGMVWLLLEGILIPSTLLASLPFAAWNPGTLTPWLVGGWYAVLGGWLVRRDLSRRSP